MSFLSKVPFLHVTVVPISTVFFRVLSNDDVGIGGGGAAPLGISRMIVGS